VAAVYLTAPFSSGIVVSSLGDWFQKSHDHIMKNLDVSTLKDEATTLPENVGNLTHSDAASFHTITESCYALC
jgi:hypothetical protein